MTSDESKSATRKTRVLFLSHSPYFYGAEQSLLCLLKGIDRTRFEPVVCLPDRIPGHEERLHKEISSLDIPVHVIQSSLWINVADEISLTKALLDDLAAVAPLLALIANEHIDIVYTNTITRISGAVAAALAGKPHLYHVREVLKDHPLRSPIGIDATFELIAQLSDAVITNSHAVATQFDVAAIKEKLHVVHNAVDPVFFNAPSAPNVLRNELAIGTDEKLIGIIGTIHPHKNHEDLIRAFALMKDQKARIIIIGKSFCSYKSELEAIIADEGIKDKVHFVPFRNDIADVMQDLDVVVVASLGEPFGRTTIEAMAASKPVVATDTGASPEIVVDGVTGRLVPLHKHQEMADAITEIISNKERAESMGRAGRERATAIFSIEKYVTSIQGVLSKLASQQRKDVKTPATVAGLALDIVPDEDLVRVLRFIVANLDQMDEQVTRLLPSNDHHLLRLKHFAEVYKQLYREKYVEAEGVYIRLGREQKQVEVLRKQLDKAQHRCADLENSLSWRITAPLRWIFGLLQRQ